ncbi:MAG: prepilin-type N-terminal cleavage/methylation domain-containing protein [Phycisphaerales bacterium]|nr:prepilin-type N-terminal cleavage/methylation domain-containing protein [Phycisphaerales bacterium]
MTRIPRRRRAFTLVELMLSMAVMTVLLGGLASAMMIASRAVPDRSTPLGATLDSAYAADQLAAELFVAKTFTVRSATAVEFTVADRNNDTVDETIRYEWSGAPGAPLTRKYNIAAAVTVLSDVNEFGLGYDVIGVTGRNYLTGVRIKLRAGNNDSARSETSVQVLNEPEVIGP